MGIDTQYRVLSQGGRHTHFGNGRGVIVTGVGGSNRRPELWYPTIAVVKEKIHNSIPTEIKGEIINAERTQYRSLLPGKRKWGMSIS